MKKTRKDSKRYYFIAGGGTAGHINPGLAIARAMKRLDPQCEVLFVGTSQGLETTLVPQAGFELCLIPGGKLNFQGRPWEKLKTLFRLPLSFLLSARLLVRHLPQAVLGVGGYASGPFLLTASILGFRTAFWEANALPGLTNRWLSRFVDFAFIVFDVTRDQLRSKKIEKLGMPVRAEIEAGYENLIKVQGRNFDEERPFRILCFGGSQGARAINEALAAALEKLGPDLSHLSGRKIEVVHQIGKTDWQKFQTRYQGFGPWLQAAEFIFDMPVRYAWADLVIGRSGASTVAEIAAFGCPAILVPLPGAEAHQEMNAQALADVGAVVILKQKDLTPERLWQEIERLKNDPDQRRKMSQQALEFFEPHAAEQIARAMMDLPHS